jgi:predicted small secreted protein
MRYLRILLLAGLLALAAVTATGCNTMQGVGEDLEQAGQAIQNAFD